MRPSKKNHLLDGSYFQKMGFLEIWSTLDQHAQKNITDMAPKFCRQVATTNSYQKPFMRPSKKNHLLDGSYFQKMEFLANMVDFGSTRAKGHYSYGAKIL
jgi:hypothetical protein